jgi:hypothetical protein
MPLAFRAPFAGPNSRPDVLVPTLLVTTVFVIVGYIGGLPVALGRVATGIIPGAPLAIIVSRLFGLVRSGDCAF